MSEKKFRGRMNDLRSERHGYCCPHCADSKFPCVNMERVICSVKKAEEKQIVYNK